MTFSRRRRSVLRFGAYIATILAPLPALAAEGDQGFDLKAGQEATFSVTVADGKVTLGLPRISKQGTAQPKEGEITVGLGHSDKKTLREDVIVVEKTLVPIDFVATGLIGGTKIDETVVCGRLDAPVTAHIGSVSWRVKAHEFGARKDGKSCE